MGIEALDIRLWFSIDAQRTSDEQPHPNKRDETCSRPTPLVGLQLHAPMRTAEGAARALSAFGWIMQ